MSLWTSVHLFAGVENLELLTSSWFTIALNSCCRGNVSWGFGFEYLLVWVVALLTNFLRVASSSSNGMLPSKMWDRMANCDVADDAEETEDVLFDGLTSSCGGPRFSSV
ncbi:hypothetical protein AVEN_257108-1 [Araneus ventricosus]|uniref:Uncharacterized protein n=1 Tax=Araneus ventricosus TaxID=182803 RepID=A0A4Y2FSN5_ARAVE|nr:hypothetical protein AVEN_257108-1 [Araneus ventricosus]